MSEQNNRHGKREAPTSSLWSQYKAWVKGMDRGRRIRYRLLQAAVVLSVLIIVGYLILSAWVQVPDIPTFEETPTGNASTSTNVAFEGAEVPDIVRSGRREGVYTFLLAGRDVASGSTDTMLLITYDTKAKTIQGLNLPRDTMVNVSTSSKRLNAVYSYNRGRDEATQVEKGMTALKSQVAKLTGITPDFYVLVEWEAIGELVDALGGVYFEVPFLMEYDDEFQNPPLHIYQEAGYRLLDGEDAMEVIRFRKSNDRDISLGDVGRLQIQQDFLKAVVKKCLQPATFLKIPSLVEIFVDNVKTDLTVGNLLAFAQLALGMDPETGVSFTTAPLGDSFNYRGAALVTLSQNKLLEVLNGGMNPYLRDIEAGDLELVYRKSDGSMGVTNGTLADPKMAEVPVVEKPEPDPEEVIDPGDGSVDPEDPDGGDGTERPEEGEDPTDPGEEPPEPPNAPEQPEEGGEPSEGPDVGELGVIDPEQIFPDPEEPASQDIPDPEENNDTVAVLPSQPESAAAAA